MGSDTILDRAQRAAFLALLASSAVLTAVGPRKHPGVALAALMVGAAAAIVILRSRSSADCSLPKRFVLAGVGALLVFSAVLAPQSSSDVWMYATYGRMIEHRHVSPYTTTPAQILRADRQAHRRPDEIIRRSAPRWRPVGAVYGPAFLGVSAIWMRVAGAHPTIARLGFQGAAAAAVMLCLAVLARRRVSPAILAVVGAHPIVSGWVVNGGHADAVIALALLLGAAAAEDDRWRASAIWAGLAAGVKATAGLGVLGLVIWTARRHGWRRAAMTAALAGGVAIGPIAAVGGRAALRPLLAARGYASRSSIWQFLGWFRHHPINPGSAPFVGAVALGSLWALAVLARSRHRPELRDGPWTAATAMGAPLTAFLLVAPYVLPWYTFSAIPLLARGRSAMANVVLVLATWQVFAYCYVPRRAGFANGTFRAASQWMGGFEAAAAIGLSVSAIVRLAAAKQTERVMPEPA